ncbi:hypothetical protein [Amycolatopsis taiwanensis]|uniref:hypothetical protein n=1 Tax=Amycolatopsis taiwanensis TaxID=342230 RepID=UPI000485E85B|nr:hypothetical protein [Amycolatopsis taiwanensis]
MVVPDRRVVRLIGDRRPLADRRRFLGDTALPHNVGHHPRPPAERHLGGGLVAQRLRHLGLGYQLPEPAPDDLRILRLEQVQGFPVPRPYPATEGDRAGQRVHRGATAHLVEHHHRTVFPAPAMLQQPLGQISLDQGTQPGGHRNQVQVIPRPGTMPTGSGQGDRDIGR